MSIPLHYQAHHPKIQLLIVSNREMYCIEERGGVWKWKVIYMFQSMSGRITQ